MAKKLMRISMIVDHTVVFDILAAAANKAIGTPEVVPVMHRGEDENGEVQAAFRTTREFVLAYAAHHPTITTREIMPKGEKAGFTKNAVYAALSTLTRERALKRDGDGTYVVKTKPTKAPGGRKRTTNPAPGESMADKAIAAIRSRQNGSGEGVDIQEIKNALVADGFKVSGVSGLLHKLLGRKAIKRVGPGLYRVPPT